MRVPELPGIRTVMGYKMMWLADFRLGMKQLKLIARRVALPGSKQRRSLNRVTAKGWG